MAVFREIRNISNKLKRLTRLDTHISGSRRERDEQEGLTSTTFRTGTIERLTLQYLDHKKTISIKPYLWQIQRKTCTPAS
jgi:hypothetical protein